MTKDEILTLARAGFTAAQIAALNSVNTAKPEPATPALAPATPAPAPATPAPATPAEDPAMTKLLEELTGIKSSIQNNNITNSNMPKAQSADDILASIINPPKEDK